MSWAQSNHRYMLKKIIRVNHEISFYLFTTVHRQAVQLCISKGISGKMSKPWRKKKTSFTYFSFCVKRMKVAWVRHTHIIIFSLKWGSRGAFLIYIGEKWQLVLSTSLPLWLAFWSATTVISRNKERWHGGTRLPRALSHRWVLLWLKYKLKSWSIKGAECDDAVLQVMEWGPPLWDKVVNQAALEVWELLEMISVRQWKPLWL